MRELPPGLAQTSAELARWRECPLPVNSRPQNGLAEELGATAQQDIYQKSSIDLALKDAFRKMRAFLMTTKGLSEDEAIALSSVAVDFGVTQVVDGNWGIHAIIKKSLFAGASV